MNAKPRDITYRVVECTLLDQCPHVKALKEGLEELRDDAFGARHDIQTPRLRHTLKRIYVKAVNALDAAERK